jgi:catechol 2,3-dioxygenase-like lactoylglutathione lyase family enzyme
VDEAFQPARKAHPALVVDDLDRLVVELASAGHPVLRGEEVGGVTQRYVDDPFGNRIELVPLA